MTSHDEQNLLSAYHDDELDAAARAALEAHLRQCPSCAAELARLRAASLPLREFGETAATAAQMRRFRDAAHRAAADDARMMRTAATLGVIAASVLIVGTAWLKVLSARAPAADGTARPIASSLSSPWSAPDRAWEHVATTLTPDPLTLPRVANDPRRQQQQLADAEFAEWMLRGLGGSGGGGSSGGRAER